MPIVISRTIKSEEVKPLVSLVQRTHEDEQPAPLCEVPAGLQAIFSAMTTARRVRRASPKSQVAKSIVAQSEMVVSGGMAE